MFIDEAIIYVKAGDGGNGSVAFRREKFVPQGGPSGGDGGRGGDIVLQGDSNLRTLSDCARHPHYKAKRGDHGMGGNKTGAEGENFVLRVPLGTQVRDAESNDLLADISRHGQSAVVARGGDGGRGNKRFVTSTRQSPRFAERAALGQERKLKLTLKMLADVALIGFPNVGKSTFISVAAGARPKIADYPFTTLVPNLGVAKLDASTQVTLADIPGLIRGAHKGAGLGDRFLKHIERAPVFIHLLDATNANPLSLWRQFMIINHELKKWNPQLLQRPQLVAINKIDAIAGDAQMMERVAHFEARLIQQNCDVFRISAATNEGVNDLLWHAMRILQKERAKQPEESSEPPAITYLQPQKRLNATKICDYEDGSSEWRVEGGELEDLVRRFDIGNRDAALYVHQQMKRRGITDGLSRLGVRTDDVLHLGDMEFIFEE